MNPVNICELQIDETLKNILNLPTFFTPPLIHKIQHFYEKHREEEEHIDVEELEERKVQENKKFSCTDCDKQFEYKSTLDRHHKTVHSKEKPHECPEEGCDKRFGLKHHLDRHQKQVHGDDRPHECPEDNCGKRFKDKYNMQVHRRIHTGLKPFVCPSIGCGKSFNQKGSFNNHTKTHNDLHLLKDERIGLTAVPMENLDEDLKKILESRAQNPVSGAQVKNLGMVSNNTTKAPKNGNLKRNNSSGNLGGGKVKRVAETNQNAKNSSNLTVLDQTIQNTLNPNNNQTQFRANLLNNISSDFQLQNPTNFRNNFENIPTNPTNSITLPTLPPEHRIFDSKVENLLNQSLPELNQLNECGLRAKGDCDCDEETPCLINHISGDNCCNGT